MTASAKTSSFFTVSPWTLIVPACPRMSTSPALFTSRLMILAASAMS
jgi:hypothetical protein